MAEKCEKPETSPKPEIQWVYQRRSGTKSKIGLESNVDDGAAFALRVVFEFGDKALPEITRLTVNSPHLLKILKSVVKNHPYASTDFESPFEIEKPYQILYHYWDNLHAAYELDDTTDEERVHLKLLLKFMQQEMGQDKERAKSMVNSGRITFAMLWTIFRPGDLMYIRDHAGPRLLRLVRTAYDENVPQGKYMDVFCWYNDYDGNCFGLAQERVRIIQKKVFPGEQSAPVKSLPVFPRSFSTEGPSLEDELAERGHRFCTAQREHVQFYSGLAWHVKEIPLDWFHPEYNNEPAVWEPYMETGRVILDKKTFLEDNNADWVSVSPQDMDDASQRMLLPPYTHGYSLARKEWCKFSINCLSVPEWDTSALDRVIIDEHRRDVLRSLVLAHEFPQGAVDLFAQKGKGLVVLLYGSPGSGKTVTAESVAEVARKPLIRATMPELNKHDRQYYFEVALQRLLKHATKWQAVVLLDEADVVLEGRSDSPGKTSTHNALVAVLLKHLEYFAGIVVLTSNLVRVFDTAMKSRIHLALEYHPPDVDMMHQIWKTAVSAIPESERELDLDVDLQEFLASELNGREIANCIHTSRTLARHEKTKLRKEHIVKIWKTIEMFSASLRDMKAGPRAGEFARISGNTFATGDAE
ncbi:P-loop containing nucleoside triphosphate hydrolase protein [Durotheca rogersii]|uniref:P-loop containing nucleoside triphosphate hydrolase protein n=1 Tax=Durotheca rogersii TaxID=419775 RepID=UPI00222091B9|nr:P-loop containing nucleoside triphosphate hydrolase protein [Durotheca rogersii]KAI5859741.1 P-loop containing nucleoside triphosphate hydrolase protein [Durotheca rogersii]